MKNKVIFYALFICVLTFIPILSVNAAPGSTLNSPCDADGNQGTLNAEGLCIPNGASSAVSTPPGSGSGSSARSTDGGFTALAPIPGLTSANSEVVNADTLAHFFNNLYKYLVGLAAALAVIQIIWAGLEIATNRDDVSKLMDDKGKIYNAILGLVLVLSPVLVFSIINPSILNLSLNLPPLKVAPSVSGITTGGTADSSAVSAAIAAGCSEPFMTQTGAQMTTCPQQKDAQAFADSCNQQPGGNGQVAEVTLTTPIRYSATCNKPFSTGGTCDVTGTSGILLIANCPTEAAATTWGQQNCTDGDLSDLNTVNPTNGVLVNITVCTGKKQYIFIDAKSVTTFIINSLQPLVTTNDRPNNGSDAMSFKNICQSMNLDLHTCVSDDPAHSNETDCGLTPKRAFKCYKETLSCRKSVLGSATLNAMCSKTPDWTIFQ